MSKRYGRNQKRRHLKEIEELKTINKIRVDTIRDLRERVDILNENNKETASIIESVCKYSVALPPKNIAGQSSRKSLRLIRQTPFRAFDNNFSFCQQDNIIDVYALELFIRENWESFTAAVHIRYHGPGNNSEFGYMVSEQALNTMPSFIIKEYAKDIAYKLTNAFKNKYNQSFNRNADKTPASG